MLFNSYAFLLAFLPTTLVGFFLIARRSHVAAAAWLMLASLFFYGWWNPAYVPLLLASIAWNYGMGARIVALKARDREQAARWALAVAIAVDLAALGYFKYVDFFLDTLHVARGHRCAAAAHHPAARHLVLHVHADRLPGGRQPRQGPRVQLRCTSRCSSRISRI